jgi:hypothetical protein
MFATAVPAQAAENVGVTVALGGAARSVVSPWAQNYRDTAYDNGPCSASINVIMRATWSVDSVTKTSLHVNSIKLEMRSLWPITLYSGNIGSYRYRTATTPFTESTGTRTFIYGVNQTIAWNSAGQIPTTQYYQFANKGEPYLCGTAKPRNLVFTMKRA